MNPIIQESDTITEIEKNLRSISSMIKQNGREILHNYPITPPQFVALQWLLECGAMTIGDLSQKMYFAYSTTTDLVDRMEKNELVIRKKDSKDRRVVQIHLLEKGKHIIQEVIAKRQEYLTNILEVFSEEETRNIQDILSKLQREMEKEA